MDQTQPMLVSVTDLRRNAGAWFSIGKPIVVIKDSKPIGTYIPADVLPSKDSTLEDDLKKIKKLAGGFSFKNDFTPAQLNRILDKRYEEMLPR